MRYSLLLYRLHSTVLLWTVPLVVFSAVLVLWNALPQLRVLWANTVGTPLPTCGCENLFSLSTHPFLTVGLIGAASVALTILIRFMWFLVHQHIQTQRFVRSIPTVTRRSFPVAGHTLSIHVVRHSDPLLFTVGMLKPRVVISLAQLRLLNAVELRAALVHEQMHIRFGHVWKRSLLHAFIRMVAIIPSFRSLLETVDIAQELQADEAAVSVVAQRHVLSALTQCFSRRPSIVTPHPLPLFAAADARFQYLLSLPLPAPLLRTLLWAAGSIVALMFSSLFISRGLFLSAAAETTAGQNVVAACMQEYEDMVESPAQSIVPVVPQACVPGLPNALWIPMQPSLDRIIIINYTP